MHKIFLEAKKKYERVLVPWNLLNINLLIKSQKSSKKLGFLAMRLEKVWECLMEVFGEFSTQYYAHLSLMQRISASLSSLSYGIRCINGKAKHGGSLRRSSMLGWDMEGY